MMDFNLSLTAAEINAILQTLSQLPTGSGVWPLMVKVQAQVEAQQKARQEAEASGG